MIYGKIYSDLTFLAGIAQFSLFGFFLCPDPLQNLITT